jgi:hypothetical protein
VVVLCLQQWDLGSDVIHVHVGLVVNVELLEVLSELLLSRLADSLCLLHEVVGHFISAIVILLIGLFVKHDLIVSLVEDSFSHVLVLFKSHHFLNVLLDDDNKIFIGLLLLGVGLLTGVS